MCANSRPALNDVTYNELTVLTKRVAGISQVISTALAQGRLLIMESGQGSPCLDLRYAMQEKRLVNYISDLIYCGLLSGQGLQTFHITPPPRLNLY